MTKSKKLSKRKKLSSLFQTFFLSMTTTIDPAALAAERAVGIEEYATACEGFDAVLKHR